MSTSTRLKKVFGYFTPLKQDPKELDDYNLATLFRVEKVKKHTDSGLKEAYQSYLVVQN